MRRSANRGLLGLFLVTFGASAATTLEKQWELDLGEVATFTVRAYGRDGAIFLSAGQRQLWISSKGRLIYQVSSNDFTSARAVSDTGLVVCGGRRLANGTQVADSQTVISYFAMTNGEIERLDWVVAGRNVDFSGSVNGGLPMQALSTQSTYPYILLSSGTMLHCYTLAGSVFETSHGPPVLGNPSATNGQFEFTVTTNGEEQLLVESARQLTNWINLLSISDPHPTTRVRVSVSEEGRLFRARTE